MNTATNAVSSWHELLEPTRPEHLFLELLDDTHCKVHARVKIAEIFQKYYTSLYNLPCSEPTTEEATRHSAIRTYLQKSGLPRLSEDERWRNPYRRQNFLWLSLAQMAILFFIIEPLRPS